jgi:leucyl/phenylalanyl-tRNA--protein transferase
MKPFGVQDLLECYARGVFPMADARDDDRVFLIDPEKRGVFPLGGFHISRRLARTVRQDLFEVRVDTAFAEVVALCAEAAEDRAETWINGPIEALYGELFEIGHAHSVETWLDGRLVGGLYGVSLKGAFFGESMFSRATDASKVALVHLIGRLIAGGFTLLDAQFMTEHLAQFGAQEIPRREYRRRLALALKTPGDFQALGVVGAAGAGATGPGAAGLATAGLGADGRALPGAEAAGGGLAGGFEAAGRGGGGGALVLQVISQAS